MTETLVEVCYNANLTKCREICTCVSTIFWPCCNL